MEKEDKIIIVGLTVSLLIMGCSLYVIFTQEWIEIDDRPIKVIYYNDYLEIYFESGRIYNVYRTETDIDLTVNSKMRIKMVRDMFSEHWRIYSIQKYPDV